MEFVTTEDRVLIEREPSETVHSSGLIVPKLGGETNYYGRVLARGPGRVTKKGVRIPMTVAVGDRVLFDPNGALPIRWEGRDCLIVRESDIVTRADRD